MVLARPGTFNILKDFLTAEGWFASRFASRLRQKHVLCLVLDEKGKLLLKCPQVNKSCWRELAWAFTSQKRARASILD